METMVKIEKEVDDLIKGYKKDIADLRTSYAELLEQCQERTEDSGGNDGSHSGKAD